MNNTEAVWAAKFKQMAQHLNRRCNLEKACNDLAQQHIQAYRKSEQNRLTQRLEEAADNTDAILPALAWLRQCLPNDLGDFAGPKFANAAPMLAAALLTIRDHLLDDQECQGIDEAGAIVQQRVDQLARELSQQPAPKLSEADQEQEDVAVVTRAIMREIAKETQAHKSPTRVRLYRLSDCIEEWRSWGTAPHDEGESVHNVARQLVPLVDYLGMAVPGQFAGGAE